jgi:hypothetical protein
MQPNGTSLSVRTIRIFTSRVPAVLLHVHRHACAHITLRGSTYPDPIEATIPVRGESSKTLIMMVPRRCGPRRPIFLILSARPRLSLSKR